MQIVEIFEGRVSTTELRLRRAGTPLEFVLYPMIHIGRPEFYAEVDRRLRGVDLVVAEGIRGGRPLGSLTSVYRAIAADPELGLVVQAQPDLGDVPVIRPDPTGEEFHDRWRDVPLRLRTALWAGSRGLLAAQRVLGSRFLLRELEGMEDLPTNAELVLSTELAEVEDVVLDQRDALLVAALDRIHEERSGEAIEVAVVYGARHMRAVVTGLRRHGYRVYAGERLTVMDFGIEV